MELDFAKIKNLQDAFVSLLNNEFLSDIKFQFADGQVLFAHSFVLCCRSAEFCDSFKATIGVSKHIEVQNATHNEYYDFLKYLYTESNDFDELNLEGIIRLSKKYGLPDLESKCVSIMSKDISAENVFTILEKSLVLESNDLRKKSTEFIARNYLTALNDQSFLKIGSESLKVILTMESVPDIDEFKIFKFALKWAEQKCLADGKEPSGSLKRAILGENLNLIRFAAMNTAQFGQCQDLQPGLLTSDESLSVFMTISTGKPNSFGFSNVKRMQLIGSKPDTIKFDNKAWLVGKRGCNFRTVFSVSNPILQKELTMFQPQSVVKISLEDHQNTIVETLEDKLQTAILLQANRKYTLKVSYSKPYSYWYKTEDENIKSEEGNCVLTIYTNSFTAIDYLMFEV